MIIYKLEFIKKSNKKPIKLFLIKKLLVSLLLLIDSNSKK